MTLVAHQLIILIITKQVKYLINYEISDSEEIWDEESNNSDDKQTYLNSMSPSYKSALNDSYKDSVYQYRYSTSPGRLDRFLRREVYANNKEYKLFNKDRTQDDLTSASRINITHKRLKDKMWPHPEFSGLIKPKSSLKTPKEDFFKQHEEDAKRHILDVLKTAYIENINNHTIVIIIIK